MNVVLFGPHGLLGSNLAPVLARRGHRVIGVGRRDAEGIPGIAASRRLDITDLESVKALILDVFPDAIINAAAISEPAQCEAAPEQSHRINVEFPATLAQLAHHLSARFIHFSSEQIFDGRHAPYRDDDPPNPPNLYGRQKAESEARVLEAAPAFTTTLRLPLLGGNSLSGTRSLHERLFGLWASGRKARLYVDEIRQPCTAENVAEAAVELLERNDLRGTFNWAGRDALSRAEMGRRIAAHFGLAPDRLIETAHQADDPAGARRQPDLSLDIATLAGKLKTRPETFEELLEKLHVPPPCRGWYHQQP